MKKVLVTGAGGFVGGHLVEHLVGLSEYETHVLTYSDNDLLNNLLDESFIHQGDLTDFNFTSNLISQVKPDIIFHLAALSVVHNSAEKANTMLTTNASLQYNILESVKLNAPGCRFIAICSANEYGLVDPSDSPIKENTPLKPLNPYAVSKISQEFLAYQYHLSYGLDVVRLRAFNHTGDRQTEDFAIPAFAKQIAAIEAGLQENELKVGNLDAVRDFTDVKDIVRAYVLASVHAKSGEVYNVGSGKGITVQSALDHLLSLSTTKINVVTDESRMRPSDVPILVSDNSKFVGVTNWKPEIKFEETLKRVLDYWRSIINSKE